MPSIDAYVLLQTCRIVKEFLFETYVRAQKTALNASFKNIPTFSQSLLFNILKRLKHVSKMNTE